MFGVAANVTDDRALRRGAKVFVICWHGDGESLFVSGLSVGGRRIKKYIAWKRLTNFRAKFVPEGLRHMFQGIGGVHGYALFEESVAGRTKAEELAERMGMQAEKLSKKEASGSC